MGLLGSLVTCKVPEVAIKQMTKRITHRIFSENEKSFKMRPVHIQEGTKDDLFLK